MLVPKHHDLITVLFHCRGDSGSQMSPRSKIQYRSHLIDGCLAAAGLTLEPW
jgi:hypothetical protein